MDSGVRRDRALASSDWRSPGSSPPQWHLHLARRMMRVTNILTRPQRLPPVKAIACLVDSCQPGDK